VHLRKVKYSNNEHDPVSSRHGAVASKQTENLFFVDVIGVGGFVFSHHALH
jgi:hypothetical protein